MNQDEAQDELWEDFIALCELNSEKMSPPQFAWTLLHFVTCMVMDTAPDHAKGIELLNEAVESGIKKYIDMKLAQKEESNGS